MIQVLVFYTALCTWVIYTFLLADPRTSTMSQLFTIKLPRLASTLILNLFGPRGIQALQTPSRYFLSLFYLCVVLGSWSIMFTYGYSWIDQSAPRHLSANHKYSGYLLFVLCIASWRKVHNTSPGYITPHTFARYQSTYPYDDLFFPRNRICPTVGIPRLPRSKYDRLTKRHVARFDHSCGWVDNAIGEENYRWFLCFLAVHVFICVYGTLIISTLFRGEVEDRELLTAVYYDSVEGVQVQASYWVIGNFMLRRRIEMAFILILMSVMGVVLGLFLMFHLWIAARGMTTNEFYKWRQVSGWHSFEKRRFEKAKLITKPRLENGGSVTVKRGSLLLLVLLARDVRLPIILAYVPILCQLLHIIASASGEGVVQYGKLLGLKTASILKFLEGGSLSLEWEKAVCWNCRWGVDV